MVSPLYISHEAILVKFLQILLNQTQAMIR